MMEHDNQRFKVGDRRLTVKVLDWYFTGCNGCCNYGVSYANGVTGGPAMIGEACV